MTYETLFFKDFQKSKVVWGYFQIDLLLIWNVVLASEDGLKVKLSPNSSGLFGLGVNDSRLGGGAYMFKIC